MLCAGVDRNILASVSLDLQMALTFSLGSPLNAGEARRDSNTAKAGSTRPFFMSTPDARGTNERTRRRVFRFLCETMLKNFLTLIDAQLPGNTSKGSCRDGQVASLSSK
jgi:hypothetical protein